MQHPDLLYLGRMLDCARDVLMHIEGADQAAFFSNRTIIDAVAYRLQCIGEAARHVSDATRDLHAEIPWHKVVGMRHRIVHDYVNVNPDIVWEVAAKEVPLLIQQLRTFVPDDPPDNDSWQP